MQKTLIFLFVLICTATLSEESYQNNTNLAPSTMPIICGHPDYVHKFITNKGFILENASLGRAGASADGEPVMMVVMYSKDDQIIVTVDIPTGESTCIMYHTFDRSDIKVNN